MGKPKRRNSRETSLEDQDPGPTVFRLTPFKSFSSVGVQPSSTQELESGPSVFCQTPLKSLSSDTASSSHPLPVVTISSVVKSNSSKFHEHEKSAKHQSQSPDSYSPLDGHPNTNSFLDEPSDEDSSRDEPPDTDSTAEEPPRILGPARPSPDLLPPESSDTIYKTKTATELAFLKRKFEMEEEKLKKKAALSHKEKIKGFNTYLEHLPEFNEQRKINWSKH